MFIGGNVKREVPTPFGGAEFKVEFHHSRNLPLLRTEPEGSCSSIDKHVAPNGAKRVNCSRTLDAEIKSPGQKCAFSPNLDQKTRS